MTSIRRLLAGLVLALTPALLSAQGVTTSSMSGIVTDRDGNPLADATVTAVHLPSNTSYRNRAPRGRLHDPEHADWRSLPRHRRRDRLPAARQG